MFSSTQNENIEPVTPSALEEGKVAPATFKDAPEAYQALLRAVLDTTSKTYSPAMSAGQAVLDGFRENGKFSLKKTSIFAASNIMGGVAAYFYDAPAITAATQITNTIYSLTGIMLPAADVLSYFMQTMGCGMNGAVCVFSMVRMFEHFFGKESEALKYLKPKDDTVVKKLEAQGRNLFDLCCAIASNVPTYLLTPGAWAIPTAVTSVSPSWLGMHNLQLGPDRSHPACALEADYLGEQIDAFLNLPFDDQNAILEEIMQDDIKNNHNDNHHRKMYLRMMHLSEVVTRKKIHIQEAHVPTLAEKIVPPVMCTIGLFSTSAYRAETYTGITGLFADPNSPQAIGAAIPFVLLSLLPGFGYSYIGGKNAGRDFTTQNKALASLYLPQARKALIALIGMFSTFSGSTTFSIAYTESSLFTEAVGLAGPISDFLMTLYVSLGTTSSSILNAYYTSKLLDELLIYFALRCGDEKVKRLFTFVLEARKFQGSLRQITKENYLEILKWKMSTVKDEMPAKKKPSQLESKQEELTEIKPSESKQEEAPKQKKKKHKKAKLPYTGLSDFMETLFDKRLSDTGYKMTQDDLKKLGHPLKDRTFDSTPVKKATSCCGLFHRKPQRVLPTPENQNTSAFEM